MLDKITYPFQNFNGSIFEVWEWISNFIPHFVMDVITYPCCYSRRIVTTILTLPVLTHTYIGITRTISWLHLTWPLGPMISHKPWNWLWKMNMSLTSTEMDFNNLCHLSVEKWQKRHYIFMLFFYINSTWRSISIPCTVQMNQMINIINNTYIYSCKNNSTCKGVKNHDFHSYPHCITLLTLDNKPHETAQNGLCISIIELGCCFKRHSVT